ncbi:hypothetical protein AVEN_58540-1 [Araneus ventricosus]|uniref:Uncharacterized protein n=1 Tax=Araneus ventricosus TaxID=182803 RepID=A0A4Y2NJD0_ARAVE|nr:hypothetical protein AVEN_58540-1 [Araneus ventricosus]
MESKLIAAFSCFLGLFAIVQALPSGSEDVEKYWKCSNYADCLSGGTSRQKLIKCIDNLKPENSLLVVRILLPVFFDTLKKKLLLLFIYS